MVKWQVLTAGSPGPVKLSKESQRSGRGVDVFILSCSGIESRHTVMISDRYGGTGRHEQVRSAERRSTEAEARKNALNTTTLGPSSRTHADATRLRHSRQVSCSGLRHNGVD